MGMFPECLMFFSFLRSRGGSKRKLDTETHCTSIFLLTLERTNDQWWCGGDDRYGGLTVLDSELNGYTETLPCAGCFCDIFTDLLRWLLNVLVLEGRDDGYYDIRDQEDRFLEQVLMKHLLHHPLHGAWWLWFRLGPVESVKESKLNITQRIY